MQFVFYKNGKKYTVTNATIYEIGEQDLSQFIITSDNHLNELSIENQLDMKEGIGWNHKTIN